MSLQVQNVVEQKINAKAIRGKEMAIGLFVCPFKMIARRQSLCLGAVRMIKMTVRCQLYEWTSEERMIGRRRLH